MIGDSEIFENRLSFSTGGNIVEVRKSSKSADVAISGVVEDVETLSLWELIFFLLETGAGTRVRLILVLRGLLNVPGAAWNRDLFLCSGTQNKFVTIFIILIDQSSSSKILKNLLVTCHDEFLIPWMLLNVS